MGNAARDRGSNDVPLGSKKGTEAKALPMSVFDSAVCPHCNVPGESCALHPYRLTTDIGGATHVPVPERACSAADLAPRQFAPECRCFILSVTERHKRLDAVTPITMTYAAIRTHHASLRRRR